MSLLRTKVRKDLVIVGCVIATLVLLLVGCPDSSDDGNGNGNGDGDGNGDVVNTAPTVRGVNPMSIGVLVDEIKTVDLGTLFEDSDSGDTLTYEVMSATAIDAFVTFTKGTAAAGTANVLTLTGKSATTTAQEITIVASDGTADSPELTIQVTVTNPAPTLSGDNPMAITVIVGVSAGRTIDLDTLFSDNSSDTLTYVATPAAGVAANVGITQGTAAAGTANDLTLVGTVASTAQNIVIVATDTANNTSPDLTIAVTVVATTTAPVPSSVTDVLIVVKVNQTRTVDLDPLFYDSGVDTTALTYTITSAAATTPTTSTIGTTTGATNILTIVAGAMTTFLAQNITIEATDADSNMSATDLTIAIVVEP